MLRHHHIGLSSIRDYLTSLLSARNDTYASKESDGMMSSRNIFRRGPTPKAQLDVSDLDTDENNYVKAEGKRLVFRDVELGHVKTTNTYIRSLKRDPEYREDGIYLKSDISQTWSDPPTHR